MSHPAVLPLTAGVGLKPDHYRDALESDVDGLWFEVHPENYMVDGGPRLAWLEALREGRALSFHGVGASLGGLDPFDPDHLSALKKLIARFEPEQVSEHATFSAHGGRYHADLLPLPRTEEAIVHLAARVSAFQEAIGRRILIENPTNYLSFRSDFDEPEFLAEVARRAGCGLLVDLNNIAVSAFNVGTDPYAYLAAIPAERVGEIHIAGHSEDPLLGSRFLIDSHDAPVGPVVWRLMETAFDLWGARPILIERDGKIPDFNELMRERGEAQRLIQQRRKAVHDAA